MKSVKESVLELLHDLPDECTWDDVLYRIYVRRKIEAGLDAADADETLSHEEVFDDFEPDVR